jgi:hypothetical protein
MAQVSRVNPSQAICDHKVPDDGVVIDRLAVPLAGDCAGIDRERIAPRHA